MDELSMRDRIGRWYVVYQGQWMSWKNVCKILGVPFCYGGKRAEILENIKGYCTVEHNGYRYRIVNLVGSRGQLYEEVKSVCELLGLELDKDGVYNNINDTVVCRCKYHQGEWVETDLHKLKRGYRPVKCCGQKVNKLAASIGLYLKKYYKGVKITVDELGLVSIYVGELDKYVIFIRANQYNKAIDENSIYIGLDTSLGETYRNGNFIWHGKTKWKYDTRKVIYKALSELIPFDYSEDNWLEAIGESLVLDIERAEKFKIKIDKSRHVLLYHGKAKDEDKVQLPTQFQREKLDHILIFNSRNQIIGEYSSFGEIVEEMKSGEFYGLKILVD